MFPLTIQLVLSLIASFFPEHLQALGVLGGEGLPGVETIINLCDFIL
jgi:hypothetical protein